MKPQHNTERGNALFFILIAVALLAALTMVISRSGSSVDQSGDFERNNIQASKVLRYAKSIETGIQDLLLRGCSENEISFWHDSDGDGDEDGDDDYYNANSPTDHSCHVFDTSGAGLTWVDISEEVASGLTYEIGIRDTARALAQIGQYDRMDIYLGFRGSPEKIENFCKTINRLAEVEETGSAPAGVFDPNSTQISAMYNTPFTGNFLSPVITVISLAPFLGKNYFCAGHAINSTVFIYAILAR